jgi:hypothetical protein
MDGRNWFLTKNCKTQARTFPPFNDKTMKYMALTHEIGKKEKVFHYHAVVVFKNVKTDNQVRKLYPGVNCQRVRLFDNCIKYISKENKPKEWGERPKQGRRVDLERIHELIEDNASMGEIARAGPVNFYRYHRGFEAYRKAIQEHRKEKTKVIIVYGNPGSGKTHYCEKQNLAEPIMWDGNFIHGWDYQQSVYLDECDKNRPPTYLLLKLMDKWKCIVNVKHGSAIWNPKTLYLSGKTHPREWIEDEYWEEFERRIDETMWISKKRKFDDIEN